MAQRRRPSCSARMCRPRGAWRRRRPAAWPSGPPHSRCSPRLRISGASRRWETDGVEAFRRELARSGIASIVSHDSYLINLASPDPVAPEALRGHPSAPSSGAARRSASRTSSPIPATSSTIDAAGLRRNAEAYTRCLRAVPGPVGGAARDHRRDAAPRSAARSRSWPSCARRSAPTCGDRVAFCADTCHLYSAGYDLVRDFDGVWRRWETMIGLAAPPLRSPQRLQDAVQLAPRPPRAHRRGQPGRGAVPAHHARPAVRRRDEDSRDPKGDDEFTQDRRMLRRLRAYARPRPAR